jgi:hypothetical protein
MANLDDRFLESAKTGMGRIFKIASAIGTRSRGQQRDYGG